MQNTPPPHPQVMTDDDWTLAVFDYISEQLDGRFRLQFPTQIDIIDNMVENIRDPKNRSHPAMMTCHLLNSVSLLSTTLTDCKLSGCPQKEQHKLIREFLDLVWDARDETYRWLYAKGVVPGQSTN